MPRSYDSRLRREQSARTRRAVIDAAAEVFAEHGWAGTTMALVAERADVAVETVYRAMPGGKPALLAAAVQASLAGGAERSEVPTDDRPGIRRVIDAADPAEALAQYAAILPSTWRRADPILSVLEAAGPDATLTHLRRELETQRYTGMQRFADQLDRSGALREDVTRSAAADVLWAVCSRANYTALMRDRGWSKDSYTAWVVRTLSAELLDTGTSTPSTP